MSDYALGGVLDYEIVENFNSKLAVNYRNRRATTRTVTWSGFLRFDRSFW
ncbi:MAG: hypothetical protein U5O39_02240 [Gammaproteobacteria bacterium]|nr:hypothetical protein [Gammaproteobacteria bacterium]